MHVIGIYEGFIIKYLISPKWRFLLIWSADRIFALIILKNNTGMLLLCGGVFFFFFVSKTEQQNCSAVIAQSCNEEPIHIPSALQINVFVLKGVIITIFPRTNRNEKKKRKLAWYFAQWMGHFWKACILCLHLPTCHYDKSMYNNMLIPLQEVLDVLCN